MTFREESIKLFIYNRLDKKCIKDLRFYKKNLRRFLTKGQRQRILFIGDKVLKWDSKREDKGKHGKFEFLWKGPFIIQASQGNNTYFLKSLDGIEAKHGPVNCHMLKHYFDPLC